MVLGLRFEPKAVIESNSLTTIFILNFDCLNQLIKENFLIFFRLAKVHAYIIHALRKDMPAVFGKESKKKELIKNLDQLYGQIQREHQARNKLINLKNGLSHVAIVDA